MIPQILNLGPLPINSFGLMIAIAIISCIYLLSISFRISGIDEKLAEKYILTAAIVGLLGARVWYVINHWSYVKNDLFAAVFSGAGFVFYGGFIVSAITMILMSRKDKIPLDKFADSFAPTLALGYAIGRVGCQLSGDGDYGVPTDSFWGMSYAHGVVPTLPGVLVHPTPVFESLIAVGILFILLAAEKSLYWSSKSYARFGLYLFLISWERFFVEFLRINPKLAYGLSEAQFISIGLAFIGFLFIRQALNSTASKMIL